MIRKKSYWQADCDVCGKGFSSTDADHELFETKKELIEALETEYWVIINNKALCDLCSELKKGEGDLK